MIVDTGTLMFMNADAQTYSGTINGSGGQLNEAGVGTLTLNGANTYSGATNLYKGNLQLVGPTAGWQPTPSTSTAAAWSWSTPPPRPASIA